METVYIIGAGASSEAGLPTGDKLKDKIASFLQLRFSGGRLSSGNNQLFEALSRHANDKHGELKELVDACHHIEKNMPLAISIDNFIDTERGNDRLALCAKMAIVDSILKAERQSKLYVDKSNIYNSINFSSLGDTWYLQFFRTLTENCNASELEERFSNVSLVVFNYDRCIEQFLYFALKSHYRLEDDQAKKLVNCICIMHPYGTVGSLPWQNSEGTSQNEFGGEIQSHQLVPNANDIRTFTEGAASELVVEVRRRLATAQRLVFLGFAFHRLNMKLLSLGEVESYENQFEVSCYATARFMSSSDQDSVKNSISHLYENDKSIEIEDATCAQLFQRYSRSLGYL
jgi:hypothetical protein